MNKLFLALVILGAGAGVFSAAHNSTIHLQQEAKAAREAWQFETQRVAVAQSQQDSLKAHVQDLRQFLRQRPAIVENPVWSALQTNQTGRLSPELHERLREELGFNWQFSPDYIVVSKAAVRSFGLSILEGGKLTDLAATVLTLTPQQRSQVDAALQQVQAEVSKWAWAHVERTEPQGNEVANYSLPRDKELMQRMRDYLTTAIADAVGGERTRVFLNPHASKWVRDITGFSTSPELIVKRYVDEDGQEWFGIPDRIGRAPQGELSLQRDFPEVLRPIFPNGWVDLAAREGFTLPEESHRRNALP